ncbi:MarR family winged helix-turn-helix transcriptional regulator [Amycolatopsis umgeniensis]|uniref:DNA-binding MarR family transcriptional regulator n=1 Tax=Amycolatopsis umgeniensis TaxID=336628 RepID=A0A841AWG5_9PSEU|nr:MarR family transcriptional regulator [Amycolatopsis umgeniensis]MBB5853239.1 DNA-binding MarR family transcriptional regulator [Amycolatopsis umgeniensis]
MAKYPLSAEELARFAHLGREGSTLTVLRHARLAERMGLSATDHKVLELVGQTSGPLTAGRIAEVTGLSTGAVTGVMDRLEKAGLARRVRDTADRRKVLIEVVPGAMERHAPLFESAYTAMKTLLEQFSPEERKVLERFQSALLDGLRDELPGNSSRP